MQTRTRLKKRPHDLHLCTSATELLEALRAKDIDPVSLVSEFVKPSFEVGILFVGSIVWRVATAYSDLDVLILLPAADALKRKRTAEVSGTVVKYVPTDRPSITRISLFPSGVEVDLIFVVSPAIERAPEPGAVRPPAAGEGDDLASDNVFLTRLATGWVVRGQGVVDRWRSYYGTGGLRIRWMAREFTAAVKDLEDMEAGIGLARGHVPMVGAHIVNLLLRTLLACNGCYSTSLKWMLGIEPLLERVDPVVRQALIKGRELAFPGLLEGAHAERRYFEDVYRYCRLVRDILSREEAMADIIATTSHDLDLIL